MMDEHQWQKNVADKQTFHMKTQSVKPGVMYVQVICMHESQYDF